MKPAHLDPVWKALSDSTRRHILDLLKQAPRKTGELCAQFGVSRFAVMKHLRVLEQARLVVVRKHGRERWNYLNPVPLQMIYERWISPYVGMWAASLLDIKRQVEKKETRRKERQHARDHAPAARV